MRLHNNHVLILILFVNCFFLNCKNENSWKKVKDHKFEYRVFNSSVENNAAYLDYGDEILLNILLKKVDGTLLEEKNNVQIILPTKLHRNIFEEVLTYAKPGDSIEARFRYLDATEQLKLYQSEFTGKNEQIILTYKILSVFTRDKKKMQKDKIYALKNGFESAEEFRKEHQSIVSKAAALKTEMKEFLKSYNHGKIDMKDLDNGLKIHIKSDGNGENPLIGQKVYFYYLAALTKDEKIFDDVFKLGARASLEIGNKDNLPKMFHQISPFLKKDMKAYIFVPSNLAYGKEGSLPIVPPNADLILYIETVEIK